MTANVTAFPELTCEIVSIGTELLLGEITDTNASWLAGQLPSLGIPIYRVQQIGDNQRRLATTLREAWQRAGLLVLTGGLGPTEDDITREAIAEVLGQTMVVAPELEAALRAFFARRGRVMPERNVKQATLIPSATVLDNPIGTAPGWFVEHDGKLLAAMPGVPVEMRRMWREQVVPKLLRFRRGGAIVSRTLKIVGIGESSVEEQLGQLVRGTNPTVATYAKNDGIHVRIAARADDRDQALAVIAPIEGQVRRIFGSMIYGVDGESLNDAVVRQIQQRGYSVAVAEAGSGAAVCSALAGPVFKGGFVLPELPAGETTESLGAHAINEARRAADTYMADIGVACALSPQPTGATRISAAVVVNHNALSKTEDHNVDKSDESRRSVMLVVQLLREALHAVEEQSTA